MNVTRAVVAGAIATASMTTLLLIEPSVGLPEIAIGQLLSTSLSVTTAHLTIGPAVGWLIHFLVGIAWAVLYAGFLLGRLPGRPVARGLAYGVLVFVLAQTVLLPIVSGGFFSGGDPSMLTGSLLGHLVYGGVLGWVYGASGSAEVVAGPKPA
jgi:uncharacterized membrane protein YagU involved in acid resistance